MIILVKTSTVTFSLDVNPADKVTVLIGKVCERTSMSDFQFNLVFAGEPMDPNATIQSHGIKKEGTIHMQTIKELTFDVEYNTVVLKVTIPNKKDLKVLELKSHICSVLSKNEPDIYKLPLVLSQSGKTLLDSDLVQNTVKRMETLILEKKGSSTGTIDESTPENQNLIPIIDKEDILSHFVGNSISNDVEIVFCFDTTTSMNAVIVEVRKKLLETITHLMKEIPLIRIGIMAMGDFCEEKPLYTLDLTTDVNKIVSFINGVKSTNGGDEPECYEYALHKAKFLSWSSHTSKAFVMIGDSPPHPPYYTNHHINWVRECDDLEALGIKIYGIVAIHEKYRYFYQTISERTNGLCILFSRFELITEMFLAICFREASSAKYEQYKKEAKERGGDKDLDAIFNDLDKPNFDVVEANPDDIATPNTTTDEASSSVTNTTDENTTTTTTEAPKKPTAAPVKMPKHYGVLNANYDKNEAWCNFLDDDLPMNESFTKPMFGSRYKPNGKKSSYKVPTLGLVIGERHIGFKSFLKTLILKTLKEETKLYFNDYRLDTLHSIPFNSLFIATFNVADSNSFNQVQTKIEQVQKQFATTPIYLLGLQSDKRDSNTNTVSAASDDKSSSTPDESSKSAPSTISLVEKSEIDNLLRNKNLLGYSECTINNPSSITSLEKKILKLYESTKQ
ncbi:hypothetical protein DICPUDRAFT_81796 [Dictyostelium purpureum]|uniref:Ubiquitin-like domain-containing protein n=1 Tax=Dictyostelium purpureum TaxID=5786 RepID=F0ZUL5_DICPU|nr:uncharacterized protein DICPUDRAFT_81796 [Dictyostelium purpureum]EGC32371.1 hypothetical protein DICPUDRAFT_81796 [Dictyostelium purpureum]|eukprot:XP_003291101.1 hypothetical protein DICPUDRAFT_81796 [Dictyostelium purpureum]